MEGLYDRPLLWPNVDTEFALTTIPLAEDYLLHTDKNNCNRFKELDEDVENNPATLTMMSEIDADMETTLFPELRKLAEMPDTDTATMNDLCNYIYWADASNLKLKFELTET